MDICYSAEQSRPVLGPFLRSCFAGEVTFNQKSDISYEIGTDIHCWWRAVRIWIFYHKMYAFL